MEAQKQELREKRTLRRQAREQKKLKKKNKKGGATETSNGSDEEIPLKPIATSDKGGPNCVQTATTEPPLVDKHFNNAD